MQVIKKSRVADWLTLRFTLSMQQAQHTKFFRPYLFQQVSAINLIFFSLAI